MLIVNLQDVNISNIPDPQNPNRQIAILNHQGRQYESIQTFDLTQSQALQGLARYFDEQGTKCAIVKHPQHYSVWREIKHTTFGNKLSERVTSNDPFDIQLEYVFRAQLYLVAGLWSEISEVLGTARATSFSQEILTSIPSISSTTDLSAMISRAMQPTQSIDIVIPTTSQLIEIYREIELIGRKYLGANYAIELLNDLQQGLPQQLKQALQSWLQKKYFR
jgi:hypothetical protein